MTVKYTRKQYMANECTFAEYYRQFVTPSLVEHVANAIGKERILRSTDPHLNDISLKEWDMLSGCLHPSGRPFNPRHTFVFQVCGRALGEANGSGGVSPSDLVCVLKSAARVIKEEANKEVL